MDVLNTVSLESNTQIKVNFDGDDLSSDAGILLFKEFLFKTGAVKLINCMFKTKKVAVPGVWGCSPQGLFATTYIHNILPLQKTRIHKDDANLLQGSIRLSVPTSKMTVPTN